MKKFGSFLGVYLSVILLIMVVGFVDIHGVRKSIDESVIYYHPTVKASASEDCNELVWGGDRGVDKFCGRLVKVKVVCTGTDESFYLKAYIDPWEKGEATQSSVKDLVWTSPAISCVVGKYNFVIPSLDGLSNSYGSWWDMGNLYFAVTDTNSTLTTDIKTYWMVD